MYSSSSLGLTAPCTSTAAAFVDSTHIIWNGDYLIIAIVVAIVMTCLSLCVMPKIVRCLHQPIAVEVLTEADVARLGCLEDNGAGADGGWFIAPPLHPNLALC